jgi:hypothetical protein
MKKNHGDNYNCENTSFEVIFGKSLFPVEYLSDAKELALGLVDPRFPTRAKVIEVDSNGEFIRTITEYGPEHADSPFLD